MSALSSKAFSEQVIILDELTMKAPKTREMVNILSKLPGTAGKKVLHIHATEDMPVFASTHNIPGVLSKTVAQLNVLDVMNHDILLLDKQSVVALEQQCAQRG